MKSVVTPCDNSQLFAWYNVLFSFFLCQDVAFLLFFFFQYEGLILTIDPNL